MINVPSEFTPTINTIYPFENLFIFEDWVTRQYIPKTEREYLPIQWTAYHVNNSYGNDKQAIDKLQKYVDNLSRDKKYWTICQYDDGIIIDLKDLDVLQFSMSKKVGVEIPLLCMPHSFEWDGRKRRFASFIGTHTHPVREHVFNILNPDYYVSDKGHDINQFCDIVSESLFGLCPRGYGLNSFRIAECMQYLTIPVYISDEFVNPFDLDFRDFGIIIEERDADRIEQILGSVSYLEIIDKQERIGEIYKEYYTYEGALNKIIKILEN